MTIYCSNLINDQDMISALGSVALPLPIDVGDACFSGLDENGDNILIAVERKKIGDIVACIVNGRYLAQAQTAKALGADVLCLIVESGDIRANPEDGLLETLAWGVSPRTFKRCQVWKPVQPAVTYSRFDQYLTELDYLTGIIVKRSRDVKETAAIIKALWDNFQQRPDQHNSLHTIYKQPCRDVLLVRPSLVRRVAAELPGLGWERSRAVADKFHSIREMVLATEEQWREVEGIGKKIAENVVTAINNGYGG